jgi:predicted transcriptional regulator
MVLISIHPHFVDKILAGDKNVEFRRRWPKTDIEQMLVYSTAPTRQLAAVVEIADVIRGSKAALWGVCQDHGGGITRAELRNYLDGAVGGGVALKLGKRHVFDGGLAPERIFGSKFQAPQSFRYLNEAEMLKVRRSMS